MIEKTCKHCGVAFTTEYKQKRMCTPVCRRALQESVRLAKRESDPSYVARLRCYINEKRAANPGCRKAENQVQIERTRARCKEDPEFHAEILRRTQKVRANNPIKGLFIAARSRSKRRGMAFNIELPDLPMPKDNLCPILGVELVLGMGSGMQRTLSSASIDRTDNTKGYIKGNVAIISDRANRLKSDGTLEEFKLIVAYLERMQTDGEV